MNQAHARYQVTLDKEHIIEWSTRWITKIARITLNSLMCNLLSEEVQTVVHWLKINERQQLFLALSEKKQLQWKTWEPGSCPIPSQKLSGPQSPLTLTRSSLNCEQTTTTSKDNLFRLSTKTSLRPKDIEGGFWLVRDLIPFNPSNPYQTKQALRQT